MSAVPLGEIATIELHYHPLRTIPSPLDVVWCYFPLEEAPNVPGPGPHPALVRGVRLNRAHTKAFVEVTFGTSKNITEYPLDLVISNMEEMDMAGLFQATRFKLDKTRELPWAKELFAPRKAEKTPIIGRLGPGSIAQLEAIKLARRMKGMAPPVYVRRDPKA